MRGSAPVEPAAAPPSSLLGRALLALGLLAGFYLLALGIGAALVWVSIASIQAGHIRPGVLIGAAVGVFAIARGVFLVQRDTLVPPEAVAVHPTDQPELWGVVREVADQIGERPPEELYLTPDVNAAAAESARLLGLVPGKRVMLLGVGLLHILRVHELRGVIAHELGHYAGGETRLGRLLYRTRESVRRTVEELEGSLLGRLFLEYLKLVLRLTQDTSRRQEFRADERAIRLVGARIHAQALRRIALGAFGFDAFVQMYVLPLWERGRQPADLYGGLRTFLADPTRREELREALPELLGVVTTPYDSHPSLSDRLRFAREFDVASPPPAVDRRPAATLLARRASIERDLTRRLTALATGDEAAETVTWDRFAELAIAPALDEAAAVVTQAVAALDEDEGPVDLDRILGIFEQRRHNELVRALVAGLDQFPPEEREEVADDTLGAALRVAIGSALVERGKARWELCWSGPPSLTTLGGDPLELDRWVESVLADPESVAGVRRVLRRTGAESPVAASGRRSA